MIVALAKVAPWDRQRPEITSMDRLIVNIRDLIDEAKCFETVRTMRWPDGVTCPHCASDRVIKNDRDEVFAKSTTTKVSCVSAAFR
jgi:DNA-directed RNA polymerase subunit RPC12/RpoP